MKKNQQCKPAEIKCGSSTQNNSDSLLVCPITHFKAQVKNSLSYALKQKENGAKIVGIMCEYTPREIIMAAGGISVCLCGGSYEMIGPSEKILPTNLCPLIKSTFGYSIERTNPFLEMADLLVAETTCDGKKKMYELLAQKRPVYILELPQKSDDQDSFERWVLELEKFRMELETRFETTISSQKLRSAINTMNQERKMKKELAWLMKAEKPPLTGRQLLDMKSLISCMPEDFKQYENALKMFSTRDAIALKQTRIRVLLTGVPLSHGAERVMDIIEDNGGLVVCQENCTGLKPLEQDIDEQAKDPIRAIAEKYYHLPCSVMTPNAARIENLQKLAVEYNAQCVIELIWQACITYDVESSLIKQLAEDTLQIPYLAIRTDYSPSDSARIALRIQSLFEMILSRQSLPLDLGRCA